jgi:hypothetical protein
MTALPDLASESWWPITRYQSPNLLQIAMPMGGLGAGCICLSGNGAFQDYSIRNKPNTTALPDGHVTREAAFATLRAPVPLRKSMTRGCRRRATGMEITKDCPALIHVHLRPATRLGEWCCRISSSPWPSR